MVAKKKDGVDEMFGSMLAAAEQEFGKEGVWVGSDEERFIEGVELPFLALQFIFDSNVVALGKMMTTAGKQMSCKSAFMHYLAGLFIDAGGMGILVDTEAKTSPSLLKQIVSDPSLLPKRHIYKPADTVEDWIIKANFFVDRIKELTKGGKERVPFLLAIDSISGSLGEADEEEIKKTGVAKAGYARDAIVVSKEMKHISSALLGLPAMLVMSRHLKQDMGNTLFKTDTEVGGGKAPGLHSTYVIWFKAMQQLQKGPVPSGFLVRMQVRKNSIGACFRAIHVPFHWEIYREADEYGRKRRAWFAWHWALSELLIRLQAPAGNSFVKSVIAVKMDGQKGGVNNRIFSDVVAGGEKMNFDDFGQAFQENDELRESFISYFDIPNHPVVVGGI